MGECNFLSKRGLKVKEQMAARINSIKNQIKADQTQRLRIQLLSRLIPKKTENKATADPKVY